MNLAEIIKNLISGKDEDDPPRKILKACIISKA